MWTEDADHRLVQMWFLGGSPARGNRLSRGVLFAWTCRRLGCPYFMSIVFPVFVITFRLGVAVRGRTIRKIVIVVGPQYLVIIRQVWKIRISRVVDLGLHRRLWLTTFLPIFLLLIFRPLISKLSSSTILLHRHREQEWSDTGAKWNQWLPNNRLYLSLFLHRFCRKACFNLVSEVVDGLLSSLSVHIVSGMNARASESISPCQMRQGNRNP